MTSAPGYGPTEPPMGGRGGGWAGVAAVVAGVALMAGCSAGQGPGAAPDAAATASASPPTDWRTGAQQALADWSSFPVDAEPRPVVLLGDTADEYDFGGDDHAQFAFLSGDWTGPDKIPDSPGSFDGYPVISAGQGLAALKARAHPDVQPPEPHTPLHITGMRLVEVEVGTDRGERSLPVWQFTMTGLHGHPSVPALATPPAWPIPAGTAKLNPSYAPVRIDGQDLILSLVGRAAGTGPCTSEYRTEGVESDHAVVYHVTEIEHPIPKDSGIDGCSLVGHARQATVHLAAPLGNRVLLAVNPDGAIGGPVPVQDTLPLSPSSAAMH